MKSNIWYDKRLIPKHFNSINKNRWWFVPFWFPWTQRSATDTKKKEESHTQTHSMFDTQRTDPSIKYSSNPHIRFRLCSIVKHTPFSRWFHTARPRIGFQLSMLFSLPVHLSRALFLYEHFFFRSFFFSPSSSSSAYVVRHVTHHKKEKIIYKTHIIFVG